VSDAPPTIDLHLAKIELRVVQSVIAQMDAHQKSGALIERRQFDDRAFQFLRSLRDRLGTMGARHAAVLAAKYGRDAGEVALLLDGRLAAIADDLSQAAAAEPVHARALRPDPPLTVSQWADRHRVLSSRGSAEAGPYRTERTPYLREIMDCLSVTSPVRRIVFKKCSQIGATEAGNCWIGYVIDHVPGPIMAVQPTVELAKRFSKQRVDPLIAESPRLRERVSPARMRDSGNTVLMKEFTGGVLVITGANSAVGLRSMPARFLFLDEVDAYPGDVGDEGDPIALAEARTRTFSFRAKILLASSPRIKGTSVIAREYERSDKRRFFVPCPHCKREQVLQFERLRYRVERDASGNPLAGKDSIHDVTYECEHCARRIDEHYKSEMLAAGRWRPTATPDDPHTRGYHLSALYSPVGWLSWAGIVRQWEFDARANVDARKSFINTVLGEEYEEEANPVPEWERLYERREDWPYRTIPERGLFLTAGADVQADRIEVDIWAWGRGLESWLVEHRVIAGDPARAETWQGVTALLGETWEHATGRPIALQRLAIDTGAFTQSVYLWARSQDRSLVLPIKGMPAYDRLVPVSGPTKVEIAASGRRLKLGLNLWTVSVSFFKREFYRQLELAKPTDEQRAAGLRDPAGYVHISTAASDEWLKQAVAEQPVVVRSRHGFATRTEWRPLRERNEALDMRVYARAAVWLLGADRWPESRWRGLEQQLDLDPPPAPAAPLAELPAGGGSGGRSGGAPRGPGGGGRLLRRRPGVTRGG
jgi:phage terminase large subunit GpA-like protein